MKYLEKRIICRGAACCAPTVLIFLLLLLVTMPVFAQDVDPSTITDDEVNAVAKEMFCLECENIPLDVCGTQACQQWRDEIRYQLAEGKTKAEILEYFRVNHGEQALAVPRDPLLRGLASVTPYLIAVLVAIAGFWVLFQWQNRTDDDALKGVDTQLDAVDSVLDDTDDYLTRLERDL